MGLVGYYKRFIEGLLQIAHPITSLQKKWVIFEWNPDCASSFQHLKCLLTSASILRITNIDTNFVVCTNA
jgi:hypothetical protein